MSYFLRQAILRIALSLLLLSTGFLGGFWCRSRQVPNVDLYLSDLQAQVDVLQTRVVILERHLDETGQ